MSLIREPAFAGLFYPAAQDACEQAVRSLLADLPQQNPSQRVLGGIVPHAGWGFSGRIAAMTIQALARTAPDVVVIFGAVHVRDLNRASVFPRGSWRTPTGDLAVDEALANAIVGADVVGDAIAHRSEHSIEVELPLIQHALPEATILPIMVRPGPWSADVGFLVARAALRLGRRPAFLASTDLTHYGPRFEFEPAGRGRVGLDWAKNVNDRRFLTLVRRLAADNVVTEAEEHRNACGAGAVAATLGAMTELGCASTVEIAHTTSAEVRHEPEVTDSVGYASVVFTVNR